MSPRGRASHGVTQSRFPALVSTPESVFWTWRHPGSSSVPWPDVDGFRKLLTGTPSLGPGRLCHGRQLDYHSPGPLHGGGLGTTQASRGPAGVHNAGPSQLEGTSEAHHLTMNHPTMGSANALMSPIFRRRGSGGAGGGRDPPYSFPGLWETSAGIQTCLWRLPPQQRRVSLSHRLLAV